MDFMDEDEAVDDVENPEVLTSEMLGFILCDDLVISVIKFLFWIKHRAVSLLDLVWFAIDVYINC